MRLLKLRINCLKNYFWYRGAKGRVSFYERQLDRAALEQTFVEGQLEDLEAKYVKKPYCQRAHGAIQTERTILNNEMEDILEYRYKYGERLMEAKHHVIREAGAYYQSKTDLAEKKYAMKPSPKPRLRARRA